MRDGTNNCNEELADNYSTSTPDEQTILLKLLDGVENSGFESKLTKVVTSEMKNGFWIVPKSWKMSIKR